MIVGEENNPDQSYKYLTTEEMKGLGDDSINIDVTNDEKEKKESLNRWESRQALRAGHTIVR